MCIRQIWNEKDVGQEEVGEEDAPPPRRHLAASPPPHVGSNEVRARPSCLLSRVQHGEHSLHSVLDCLQGSTFHCSTFPSPAAASPPSRRHLVKQVAPHEREHVAQMLTATKVKQVACTTVPVASRLSAAS